MYDKRIQKADMSTQSPGHLSTSAILRRPQNLCLSSIKVSDSYKGINWDKQVENRKSSPRYKAEHPYFDCQKTVRLYQSGIPWYSQKHEPFPYPVRQRKSDYVCQSGSMQRFFQGTNILNL